MGTVSQIDGVLATENAEFRKKSKSKYMKLLQRKPYGKYPSHPV